MADDELEWRVKTAVLETELRGLKVEVAGLRADIRILMEALNKGRGAFGFAVMFSGMVGAAVIAGVDWLLGRI